MQRFFSGHETNECQYGEGPLVVTARVTLDQREPRQTTIEAPETATQNERPAHDNDPAPNKPPVFDFRGSDTLDQSLPFQIAEIELALPSRARQNVREAQAIASTKPSNPGMAAIPPLYAQEEPRQ